MDRSSLVRKVATPAVLLAVAMAGPAGTSEAAGQRTDRAKLVGSWKLESAVLLDSSGKSAGEPFGERPVGRLTYTKAGRVWALVGRRDEPRSGAQWYTGTFSVNPRKRTVTHHVEYSTVASWEGTDLVRRYRFRGRRTLILSVAVGADRLVLTWKRA